MCVVYSNINKIEKVFKCMGPSTNQLTLDVVLHFLTIRQQQQKYLKYDQECFIYVKTNMLG